MKILNLNKQWPSKKYSEIFDLGWERLTLSERDKEYSPSSVIGGNYEPFIKKYLSESTLARSKVNSKKYKYGSKENQIVEISCSNYSHSKKASLPILVFFHGGYWQELSIQESFFPFGTVLVSGIYEVEPLIGTSTDNKLSLNPDQAVRNSPMLSSLKNFPSTIVAWGENETDQFKRQSKFFANKLIDENVSVRSVEIKNKNHFDIILDLANFDEPLGKELKELLRV